MAKSSDRKPAGFRDAKSGKYVTEKYAKSHPNTTVKETKPGGSTPGKKSK